MKKCLSIGLITCVLYLTSCQWLEDHHPGFQKINAFSMISEIELVGGETAAEISAFDPKTNRLFVINAVKSAIEVVDMSDPFNLVYETEISVLSYGSGVNSVSVNNGLLAAAIESSPKTDPGKVVVWNTNDLSEKGFVTVGSLPDMVTFSNNGKFIVCANEGEPNEDYSVDPLGTVSIIKLPSFQVSTLDFKIFGAPGSIAQKQRVPYTWPNGNGVRARCRT